MSGNPTEKFYPVQDKAVFPVAKPKPNPGSVVNLVGGLVLLAGLLAWVWTTDWRWAASGVLLSIALWLVAYHYETDETL